MNKQQAIDSIQASLLRGSSTPCPMADAREEYIADESSVLLKSVVEPFEVLIRGEGFEYGVKDKLSAGKCFIVASRETYHLVYSPIFDEYALGHDLEKSGIIILGFSSSDALSEWLG